MAIVKLLLDRGADQTVVVVPRRHHAHVDTWVKDLSYYGEKQFHAGVCAGQTLLHLAC